ncbi:death domain-containing protein [Endozoicomonas sp. SCSIO W0465]|uniref:death domain-containing protein n=1 Tax=Endozoicomonas sp. SCSIO W0465 TaxID=2918516 RepID=UPI002076640A|nr:death domain-containing protein [Endozoicomonas sp. SCSIO W0465]USE33838.1 death domain-containing protein [Endozoicomonas sp. SCSIO W0465]
MQPINSATSGQRMDGLPTYDESQRMVNARQETVQTGAQAVLGVLSGYSPDVKTDIIKRTIALLNQDPSQTCPLYLSTTGASQANPGEAYPVLNQWIKDKLSYMGDEDLGTLAFATGHWKEFKQALNHSPYDGKLQLLKFFQDYFVMEGTNGGVAKLWGIMESGLLDLGPKDRLRRALEALTPRPLEMIQPNGQSSCHHDFNYLLVTTALNKEYGYSHRLISPFGLNRREAEQLEHDFRNYKLRGYELLNKFLENTGDGENVHEKLIRAFDKAERRDLMDILKDQRKLGNLT